MAALLIAAAAIGFVIPSVEASVVAAPVPVIAADPAVAAPVPYAASNAAAFSAVIVPAAPAAPSASERYGAPYAVATTAAAGFKNPSRKLVHASVRACSPVMFPAASVNT